MSKEKEINIEDGNVQETVQNENNEQTTQNENTEENQNTDNKTEEGDNNTDAADKKAEEIDPLTKAQQEVEELKKQLLYKTAEFENYRKRTLKEKAELILNGGEKTVAAILPVLDDFERAIKTMETAKDVKAVKEGVELIYNKFMATLAQNGVKVIETKDQPLDTDYHEAIAVIPAPSEEQKGKILDCVQTGYTLNDKVIRHAKVAVGQ